MFNRKINNKISDLEYRLDATREYAGCFREQLGAMGFILKKLGYRYYKPEELHWLGRDFLDNHDLIAHESGHNIYKIKEAVKVRKSLPKKGKKGRR